MEGKKNMPLLSIIIPVYNVERYIERCVNSIINQSYQNFELIIIDDGSIDGSSKILDVLSSNDNRIQVYHVKNGGVSRARNLGLSFSKGDFIAFVDADDIVKNEMYTEMISIAQTENYDMVQCNYEDLYEDGNVFQHNEIGTLAIENEDDMIIACMERVIYANIFTKLFRKKTISSIYFDESIEYAEDLKFVVDCCEASKKIKLIELVGYQYFQRNDSADHKKINESYLSILKVADYFKKMYFNNNTVYPYVIKNDVLQTKYLIDRISVQQGKMKKYLPSLRKRLLVNRKFIRETKNYRIQDKIKIIIICVFPNLYSKIYYLYNNKYSKKL